MVQWAYSSNNKLASVPRVEGLNPLADFLFWRMYRVEETKNVSFEEEEEEEVESNVLTKKIEADGEGNGIGNGYEKWFSSFRRRLNG